MATATSDAYSAVAGATFYVGRSPEVAPPVVTGLPDQYILTDAGEGPTRALSSYTLNIAWRNYLGDWIDAAGVEQGSVSFNTPVEVTLGVFDLTVTALVQKWQAAGIAKGFLIRGSSVTFSGRTGANPPVLVVEYASGVEILTVRTTASWSSSSAAALDSRASVSVTDTRTAGISVDARLLRPGIISAKLRLNVATRSGARRLYVFEANPQRYELVDASDPAIEYGVASVEGHPSILRRPSFGNLTNTPDGWSDVRAEPGTFEVLYDDPHFPGEPVYRGMFRAGTPDEPHLRTSFGAWVEFTEADLTLPGRPMKMPHNSDVMHARIYMLLEDDWRSSHDGNKMDVGWDLRLGYWSSGKWINTTGNDKTPGSGRKVWNATFGRWEYEGHSLRGESGKGPHDPNDPYESLRPIETYTYHLDQPGLVGDKIRHGTAVYRRMRWHCVERRVKLNSIVGPYDANGNGTAVADGELVLWVDGKEVHRRMNMRWRRHPEMAIQGPWINWFYGGDDPCPIDMHYRMADFIVASEYIGPRPEFNRPDATADVLAVLPPRTWSGDLMVGGSYNNVVIERLKSAPDFNTYYVTPEQGTLGSGSAVGTSPWSYSSPAYVGPLKCFYFTGGGHQNWLGSEVGKFSLETLSWVRTDESAKLRNGANDPTVPFSGNDPEGWRPWRNSSGRFAPISSHTYASLLHVPGINKIYVHGNSTYRHGEGGVGGGMWIDAATGHWDEAGAFAGASSGFRSTSLLIPTVHVVSPSLVPTGETIQNCIFRAMNVGTVFCRVVDPVAKTEWTPANYTSASFNPSCTGCLIPDPVYPGRLAYACDDSATKYVLCHRVDLKRTDGGTTGGMLGYNYGGTKPAALGTGVGSRWIYMGDHIPGCEKIAVFYPGSGLYALDITTWTWSTVLLGSPVPLESNGLWKCFEYLPEYDCFCVFRGDGSGFHVLKRPAEFSA